MKEAVRRVRIALFLLTSIIKTIPIEEIKTIYLMKNKIIEEFKENIILNSIRTQFIQVDFDEDLLNYVTFGILKNNEKRKFESVLFIFIN